MSRKIHSVFIFLRSGETLISVLSPVVKLDQTLLTGLLTAIREFGHEAIDEEIRTIEAGEYRFHYDVLNDLVTVGLADSDTDLLEVQAVLHSLNVLFLNTYDHIFKDWDGGTRIFDAFVPTIEQALAAHNNRYVTDKHELTPAEYLLNTLGGVLDVLLLNVLIGSAIIISCDPEKTTKIRESLNEMLPFRIPHMEAITDIGIAQGILHSRGDQVHKTSTLLGVTDEVYDLLITPEYSKRYLFLRGGMEGDCQYQSSPDQPEMNIAKTSLRLGSTISEQGKYLEFQLKQLIEDLRAFIRFRKDSPDLSDDGIQSLLHLIPERFELLVFLFEEFGSSSGPLSSSII